MRELMLKLIKFHLEYVSRITPELIKTADSFRNEDTQAAVWKATTEVYSDTVMITGFLHHHFRHFRIS